MYSVWPVHIPVVSNLELYGYLFTYVYLCFAFSAQCFSEQTDKSTYRSYSNGTVCS